MIFVFGGAYQGKTDFIKENFNVEDNDIYTSVDEVDFSYKVIKMDKFFSHLLKNGILPTDYLKENIALFQDKIVCMTDVSCGVVSVDKETRLLREEVSRCMVIFSKHSDKVFRVCCGIGMQVK